MQELALHIEYLLKRHDCVIVPGFGAFLATRHPAVIIEETAEITPPYTEYRFNAAVSNNDGLLANSIARRNSISFAEAVVLMEKETAQLRHNLEAYGEVTIGRLGSLVSGEEKRITFIPFMPDLQASLTLGMPTLPLPSREEESEAIAASLPEEGPVASHPEPQPDSRPKERHFSDKYYYIPVNKTFAKVAASLIIVATMALSVIFSTLDNQTDQRQYASVIPPKVAVAHPQKKSVRKIVKPAVSPAQPEPEIQEGKDYYLIVATFRTQAEAETFIASHNDFDSLEAVPGKTNVRVAAASSETREELLQLMRSDSFRSHFRDSWIWENDRK